MCISATVSFSMAGLLIAGGGFCVHKARQINRKYVPLALFPVFVGIQQFIEGYVWTGIDLHNQQIVIIAALAYLFFAWMVWPVWVPYMVWHMEDKTRPRKRFLYFSIAGAVLGLVLYLPNFWHPEWLTVEAIRHSIAYQCTLITDLIIPPRMTYVFYLSLIGLPPLLSSHRFIRIFGIGLVTAVPLTVFFFLCSRIRVVFLRRHNDGVSNLHYCRR